MIAAAAGEFDAFACTYEVHAPRHAAPVSRQSPRLRSRRVRAGCTDVLRAAVRRHRDSADVLGDPGARERQPESARVLLTGQAQSGSVAACAVSGVSTPCSQTT